MKRQTERSYGAMRRTIRQKLREGEMYTLYLPNLFIEGETTRQRLKLLRIYPYCCLFEKPGGLRTTFPLYEVLHMINGERWSTGLYKGIGSASVEEQYGMELV